MIILKENETIRDSKIVKKQDRKIVSAKSKFKNSKKFNLYKHFYKNSN